MPRNSWILHWQSPKERKLVIYRKRQLQKALAFFSFNRLQHYWPFRFTSPLDIFLRYNVYFAACKLDYICLFCHFSSKRKTSTQITRMWKPVMSVPARPQPAQEGIALVLTFPIETVDHHTVDTVVHLTLSISIAYTYTHTCKAWGQACKHLLPS